MIHVKVLCKFPWVCVLGGGAPEFSAFLGLSSYPLGDGQQYLPK